MSQCRYRYFWLTHIIDYIDILTHPSLSSNENQIIENSGVYFENVYCNFLKTWNMGSDHIGSQLRNRNIIIILVPFELWAKPPWLLNQLEFSSKSAWRLEELSLMTSFIYSPFCRSWNELKKPCLYSSSISRDLLIKLANFLHPAEVSS